MIQVKFEMDGDNTLVQMSVKGHAMANVPGLDTICAGASTLAYTLAQNLKIAYAQGMLRTEPKIKLKSENEHKADVGKHRREIVYFVVKSFFYL